MGSHRRDPHHHAEYSVCHRVRRVNARFDDGRVYCQTCYQRPLCTCADCGQQAQIHVVADIGPVCGSC